ncbi:HelD family protein [Carnobacterium alterfunditum]|uniref:HelD family protein n=1 Tax=Carnobacterium alterfunditum TaxID=28230 RepID=UPI003593DE92
MNLQVEKAERAYLRTIQAIIYRKENEIEGMITQSAKEVYDLKKYFWSSLSDMDSAEKNFTRTQIFYDTSTTEHSKALQKKLEKTKKSPYFARIDFKEKDELNPIYIGINGLLDDHEIVIHDWRAPVSSIFYDYERGPAQFTTPDGTIEGELTLKRQYKIENSELLYMIESNVSIDDDILQKELSNTSDEKMKNIVATIQKEQNEIIRFEESKTLIIQGAAGSGKTSIALHRIAFMLYRFKNTIKASDVLVLSPNKVFGSYISNVLPELGEDNVPEITFEKIGTEIIGGAFYYETFAEQVAYLLENDDDNMKERISHKASSEYNHNLTQYLENLEENYFEAQSITIGKMIISKEEIAERMKNLRVTPLKDKILKLGKDLIVIAKIKCENSQEKWEKSYATQIKKQVASMLPFKNSKDIYWNFYEVMNTSEMFKKKKNSYEFSDVFPLAYTSLYFDKGSSRYEYVKHLLVDEMQDYTPVQYAVLKKLFSCQMTILGDAYQAVNPYSASSLDKIQSVFPGSKCVTLRKSYRSTMEIAEMAQKISPNPDIIPIERHGEIPTITECANKEEQVSKIRALISGYQSSGSTNIGIICRTEKMAQLIYESIQDISDTYFLDFSSELFLNGIIVTSAHMSKGLEFDQVIVPNVSSNEYRTEMDRKLLYVACTRAMHKLDLIAVGSPSVYLSA